MDPPLSYDLKWRFHCCHDDSFMDNVQLDYRLASLISGANTIQHNDSVMSTVYYVFLCCRPNAINITYAFFKTCVFFKSMLGSNEGLLVLDSKLNCAVFTSVAY